MRYVVVAVCTRNSSTLAMAFVSLAQLDWSNLRKRS